MAMTFVAKPNAKWDGATHRGEVGIELLDVVAQWFLNRYHGGGDADLLQGMWG